MASLHIWLYCFSFVLVFGLLLWGHLKEKNRHAKPIQEFFKEDDDKRRISVFEGSLDEFEWEFNQDTSDLIEDSNQLFEADLKNQMATDESLQRFLDYVNWRKSRQQLQLTLFQGPL